jgi:hypothetical protein
VGISIVFEIFSNLPFLGVGLTPGGTSSVLHILSVTQGYIWLRISIVFEIFSNLPFLGGGDDPRGHI